MTVLGNYDIVISRQAKKPSLVQEHEPVLRKSRCALKSKNPLTALKKPPFEIMDPSFDWIGEQIPKQVRDDVLTSADNSERFRLLLFAKP